MTISDALEIEYGRRPRLEIADAVKLIYQHVFGPGHMIRDEEAARTFLLEEMRATEPDEAALLLEPIGNGLCRMNLAACRARGVSPDTVLQKFLRAASAPRGSREELLKKLPLACALPLDGEAAQAYLAAYRAAGCPAVSHSPAYRAAYRPHYRVVLEETE